MIMGSTRSTIRLNVHCFAGYGLEASIPIAADVPVSPVIGALNLCLAMDDMRIDEPPKASNLAIISSVWKHPHYGSSASFLPEDLDFSLPDLSHDVTVDGPSALEKLKAQFVTVMQGTREALLEQTECASVLRAECLALKAESSAQHVEILRLSRAFELQAQAATNASLVQREENDMLRRALESATAAAAAAQCPAAAPLDHPYHGHKAAQHFDDFGPRQYHQWGELLL